MPKLTTSQIDILTTLGRHFFDVVPETYKGYCALNSSIMHRALAKFSIPSKVQPCQLWYVTPSRNIVVGFIRDSAVPGRWDGHAVCTAKDWFVDAALVHLRREYDVKVPDVIVSQRFRIKSQTIARADLSATRRLWWMNPPEGIDATPPHEPDELVETHATRLAKFVRSKLAALLPIGLTPTAFATELSQDLLPLLA